jgi:hypothetical protein
MSDNFFNSNTYVTFDGTSLRDLIINRLNQGQVFTDQNYQGSNFSALIDVISYSFSTLLFYLNKTSSESTFSDAQVYENMNRIVKLLNYKPVGRLTQNVPFDLSINSSLSQGNYFIPRYSYVNVGGTTFSFNQDVNFSKLTNGQESIADISNNYLLYQGTFQEYPLYSAAGIDNEVLFLSLSDNTYIDHFNIHVYVKPQNTTSWKRWSNVTELFLHGSVDEVYETRFNENKKYEIKFGDNINGKKLNQGDQIAVYYLKIDPTATGIGANSLNGNPIVKFNSVQYNTILTDTNSTYENALSPAQLKDLTLSNVFPSTSYSSEETVDDIRQNAPKNFRSQYRLVTIPDYETFVKTNYANLLADVKVVPNDDYLKGHIRYLYDIGLNNPQLQNQILFNQIKFANSCNFNNLYVYCVPKNVYQEYLSAPQKEIILNGLQDSKTITTQIVPIDPVYVYMDFYVAAPNVPLALSDINNSKLRIIKTANTRRADSSILNDVKNVFSSTFNRTTSKLGQLINMYQLSIDLLNIDGIQAVQTYRADVGAYVNGVSLVLWNNLYPTQDISLHTQNVILENFKYPIFNNISDLSSRIEVVDNFSSVKAVEF